MGHKRRAELEEDQEVLKKKLKEIHEKCKCCNDNSVWFNVLLLFYSENFFVVMLYHLALRFLAA